MYVYDMPCYAFACYVALRYGMLGYVMSSTVLHNDILCYIIVGQCSKTRSGTMGPGCRSSELLKGMVRLRQATILGLEPLTLKTGGLNKRAD